MPQIDRPIEVAEVGNCMDSSIQSGRHDEGYFRAAKAILLDEDDRVLVLRRNARQRKPGRWDVPGGELRPHESPIEGIVREIWEETGLEVSPKDLEELEEFGVDDARCRKHVFRGRIAVQGELSLTEHDMSDMVSLPQGAELLEGTIYADTMLYLAGVQRPLVEAMR